MADFTDTTNRVRLTISPIKISNHTDSRWLYAHICLVETEGNSISFYFNLSVTDITALLDNSGKLLEGSPAAVRIKDANAYFTLETAAEKDDRIRVDCFHDGTDCKKHLTGFLTTKDSASSFFKKLAEEYRRLLGGQTAETET